MFAQGPRERLDRQHFQVFGMMGYPTQSAYNASKFAVRGLTEALHLELEQTDPGIKRDPRASRRHQDQCGANSKVIAHAGQRAEETPGDAFEKAARTTPEAAAETIIRGMEKGQHRVLIGAGRPLHRLDGQAVPCHPHETHRNVPRRRAIGARHGAPPELRIGVQPAC
jgi:hypothetical protein